MKQNLFSWLVNYLIRVGEFVLLVLEPFSMIFGRFFETAPDSLDRVAENPRRLIFDLIEEEIEIQKENIEQAETEKRSFDEQMFFLFKVLERVLKKKNLKQSELIRIAATAIRLIENCDQLEKDSESVLK